MKEWPLILFTLATQIACGLSLAATAVEYAEGASGAAAMRPLAVAIFPILAAGLALSMAHLGRPRAAWRTLANLRRSRLSREILFTGIFAAFALAYSGSWWVGSVEGRLLLGAATGVAGVAAVSAAALVYAVPTQPRWKSGRVQASFFGATLLLGGLLPATLIRWTGSPAVLHAFLTAAMAGAVVSFAAALRIIGVSVPRRGWLACHVLFTTVLPIAAAMWLWSGARLEFTPAGLLVAIAALFGAIAGRAMMLAERCDPF